VDGFGAGLRCCGDVDNGRVSNILLAWFCGSPNPEPGLVASVPAGQGAEGEYHACDASLRGPALDLRVILGITGKFESIYRTAREKVFF